MNQIQLDCFVSAALSGSISTAAKSLFLSTQVVSQHIQRLEAEVGSILFIRTKTGVRLTETGEDFFNLATEWSTLYKNAIRDINEAYSGMSSSLNIGLSEYIDYMGEISNSILAFTQEHGNVVIKGNHYKSSMLLNEIMSGELDIAIIPDSQIVSGGDFNVVTFAKEDLHLHISGEVKNPKKIKFGNKEFKELCASRPQLTTSYGVWTDTEWKEISSRMTDAQKINVSKLYELPNFRSVIATLPHLPSMVVCDRRFGYQIDESIFHLPIEIDSWLCCVWNKRNENHLIETFANHMQEFYNTPNDRPASKQT